jgi:hypothetical protein
MKYTFEMGSGAMIYMPKNTNSDTGKEVGLEIKPEKKLYVNVLSPECRIKS